MEMEGEIYYPNYTLEREISNLIKVWISVVLSLCYCFISAKFIPRGMPRFFSFIPVVSLFFALPLKLHSVQLGGNTAFFIAWLSNFKLLLLAFGEGPLSDPSLSPLRFIAVACFPIRIEKTQDGQNPPTKLENSPKYRKDGHNSQNPPPNGQSRENPGLATNEEGNKSVWNYAVKIVLLALFLRIYEYSDRIHPKVILVIYCLHIYFSLEIVLAMAAAVARALFGLELEPQFNDPYLSTSLQDFWGRRWNLVVSRALRPTVYDPILCVSTLFMSRKWAALPAAMCTFVVSALMHELMFFYMGRVWPTWEITWFFLLHGACLVVEIGIKKVVKDRCRLPRVIATPMTVGFVMVTGFWLFFPQFLRCKADVRGLNEYALAGAFAKDIIYRVVKLGNFGAGTVE